MSRNSKAPRRGGPRSTYSKTPIGDEEKIQAVAVRMSQNYRPDKLHYEVAIMYEEPPYRGAPSGWWIVSRMRSGSDAAIYARIIAKRTGARYRNYA